MFFLLSLYIFACVVCSDKSIHLYIHIRVVAFLEFICATYVCTYVCILITFNIIFQILFLRNRRRNFDELPGN